MDLERKDGKAENVKSRRYSHVLASYCEELQRISGVFPGARLGFMIRSEVP